MNDAPLVVGLDCSTSACKAVAFELDGTALCEGRAPLELHSPEPGAWVQDAESWWTASLIALASLAGALGRRAADVCAIAVSNQRETFVLTDSNGAPLAPALTWMDARCAREVRELTARFGAERLHELSGKVPCTTPSIYKLAFQLGRLQPELAARRPRVLDVHAFVVWRLTGRCATSWPAADPLGLFDCARASWSRELCDLVGIRAEQLPELEAPGGVIGELRESVADATGLPVGTLIVAGAGDGQAAALGAGITNRERAYLNLGTALVLGVVEHGYATSRAFRTLLGAEAGTWLYESDLKSGSFTLDYFARLGGAVDVRARLTELERAAVRIPPGSDGLFVLPHLAGAMNPHWDDDARGLVYGLTGGHGPAHLHRAALEGLAFEQRLAIFGIEAALGARIGALRLVGGGAKSALFAQILADVTGKPIERVATREASALGAAMLAAVGVGLHDDVPSAQRAMTHAQPFAAPGASSELYDALYGEVYRELYSRVAELGPRVAALSARARTSRNS